MENKITEKTKEELQYECNQLLGEVLALSSLSDIMKAKDICERILVHSWNMYGRGCQDTLDKVMKNQ